MLNLKLINKSEIARLIGVSTVYVHYLFSGAKKNDRRMKEIAGVLKVPVEALKSQIMELNKNRRNDLQYRSPIRIKRHLLVDGVNAEPATIALRERQRRSRKTKLPHSNTTRNAGSNLNKKSARNNEKNGR